MECFREITELRPQALGFEFRFYIASVLNLAHSSERRSVVRTDAPHLNDHGVLRRTRSCSVQLAMHAIFAYADAVQVSSRLRCARLTTMRRHACLPLE